MSEPENFLSRWSRLKQEEKAAAPSPAEARAPLTEGDRESAPAVPPESPKAGATQDQPFDLTTLPSLESITAGTDIKPFLAAGVPAELRHAALRRAWSADPQICDFVGLAEYAWDFNAPDSMPGFGPLEMTDELRRIARNIVGDREPEAEPAAPPHTETVAVADDSSERPSPEQMIDEAVQRNANDAAVHSFDIAVHSELEPDSPQPDAPAPRRGGRALPT